jgi:aspartyl-tRNA(Asn)/glutamyl-tRNA(Gln) amidotransferase subunit B
MSYEAVIGIEVHVELLTRSKMFCRCSAEFGAPPNSRVCPVCLGMPGVLPVINKRAVEFVIMTGLALNCRIADYSKLDRKNYFYPDLPKNYQISQYDLPIALDGLLEIELDGTKKRVAITRVHIEEDTGKNLHPENASYSQVDFNRCGVPLMEIVSEPDMRSPQEAYEYLQKLKAILEYLEVSDCNMEEGSLRAEANVSLRPVGSSEYGTKTEIKNVNSFKGVQKALEYEIDRQSQVLSSGGTVVQETRMWDEEKGITATMRSKERAHDYRYFPEPDLVPVVVDEPWVEEIRKRLPELPGARRVRFVEQYGIPDYDAGVLTASKAVADYYEECVRSGAEPKGAGNWIMGDLQFLLRETGTDIAACKVSPENLAAMLKLIADDTISGKIAKTVFKEMFMTGRAPAEIVRESGLQQITDEGEVGEIINKIIRENPDPVESYRRGKTKAMAFLVGQVMRATKGKANPQLVNKMLEKKLS